MGVKMKVEVFCSKSATNYSLIALDLPDNATVHDALVAVQCEPESDVVGIRGEVVAMYTLLKPGDRVEIYRPLKAPPKLARKVKAADEARRKKVIKAYPAQCD